MPCEGESGDEGEDCVLRSRSPTKRTQRRWGKHESGNEGDEEEEGAYSHGPKCEKSGVRRRSGRGNAMDRERLRSRLSLGNYRKI